MARLSEKLARHAQPAKAGGGNGLSPLGARDTLTELPLSQIEPDPNQPRKDLGDLTELAASIASLGVVQPIIVSVVGMDRYRILAGERRFSAAGMAGLSRIPAIVRSAEEQERLQVQVIENLHRKDLTPFEEARSYEALMSQFNLRQEDIARRLGKSQESVSEALRLLDLSEEIQDEYDEANKATNGRITRSLLLQIARRPAGEQEALWAQARAGQLTVKKARAQRMPSKVVRPYREMYFRYPITLPGAIVTVQFDRAKAGLDDVIDALEAALRSERERNERQ